MAIRLAADRKRSQVKKFIVGIDSNETARENLTRGNLSLAKSKI